MSIRQQINGLDSNLDTELESMGTSESLEDNILIPEGSNPQEIAPSDQVEQDVLTAEDPIYTELDTDGDIIEIFDPNLGDDAPAFNEEPENFSGVFSELPPEDLETFNDPSNDDFSIVVNDINDSDLVNDINDSDDFVDQPIVTLPQSEPTTVNANLGGRGSSVGHFSIPDDGAKVWVFFHGGDTQRPVYFAAYNEPGNVAAHQQLNSSPRHFTTNNRIVRSHGITGRYSGIELIESVEKSTNSEIPLKTNSLTIGSENSQTFFDNEGVKTITDGDMVDKISGSLHTLAQNINNIIQGDLTSYTKGTTKILCGKQDKKAVESFEKTQKIISDIQQKKLDTIRNTESDTIPCPFCTENYLSEQTGWVNRILGTITNIANYLPFNCFNWPITQFLFNTVIVPALTDISGLFAMGGDCGNPDCENGMVKTGQKKLESANEVSSKELEQKTDELNELAQDSEDGSYAIISTDDIFIGGGIVPNDSPVYEKIGHSNIPIKSQKSEQYPIIYNDNSKAIETKAHVPSENTRGNVTVSSANKLQIIAGSSGIEQLSQGPVTIKGGSVDIVGAENTVSIASDTVSTIKGGIVEIVGGSTDGNGGVRVSSKNTSIGGALHVDADLAVKGTAHADALATKHLIMPSMRSQTTASSSPKSVTNSATWYLEGAVALDIQDKTTNMLTRNLAQNNWIFTPDALITLMTETYDGILLNLVFEPVPIGFAMTYFGIFPVIGFTHTHGLVSQTHTHDITLPKGNYYNDSESWNTGRPSISEVPTPAPAHGDGYAPGPKSLGGCGGSGFGFSNQNGTNNSFSKISKNRVKRNQRFGVSDNINTSSNNNQIRNYGRIVPNENWAYGEDGQIVPNTVVKFSISEDC